MNLLDMKTILFDYFVTNFLITVIMLLLWHQNRKRYAGISFWMLNYVLQTVGILLNSLRGAMPDIVAIVIGNLCIGTGIILMYTGLTRFEGQSRSQRHNWLFLAGVAALMAYFTFVQPNIGVRIILISIMGMVITLQCSWLLLRHASSRHQPITRFVGFIFIGYALTAVARIVLVFVTPPPADFLQTQSADTLAIFANQILGIALTLGLIMLINHRLFTDLKTEEAKFSTELRQRRDQLEASVKARTFELASANTQLTDEIAERRRTEIRREALLQVSQMTHASEQAILDFALEQSLQITGSRVGYIYFYSETTRQFTLYSWSKDVMRECTIQEPQTVYDLDKTGIWGEAVRQRKTILVNDFVAPNDLKKGYPAGHVQLTRYLTIPIFEDEQIVAVVGVGNKVEPYNERDEKELILLMQGVWSILREQRIERELRASEERYRQLIETAEEGIWTIDPNGVTTFANAKMVAMLGTTVDEMMGKSFYDFMNAEDRALAEKKLERRRQGIKEQHEFKFRRKDGTPLWALLSANPIRKDGEFVGALAMITDITERKQSEEKIRHAIAQWQTTFDAISDCVFLLDRDGRIQRCNAAVTKLLNKDNSEIVGKECCQVVHGLPQPIHDCPFVQMRISHHRETVDLMIGNGWYTASVDPLFSDQGEFIGGVHTLHNITERKIAEGKLLHANTELDHWVHELEQNNFQITLLNEMGELLQSCHTGDEVYRVASRFAQQLFPDECGGIFIQHPDKKLVEAVVICGNLLPTEQVFAPTDCWGLRRNRTHLARPRYPEMICQHVKQTVATSLCIPMVAQNETIGLFHLIAPSSGNPSADSLPDTRVLLAETFANRLALVLSNLRLQQVLHEQATRDQLTGLFNRRYFEETLEREFLRAQRGQLPLALIMLDLDHLKQINDAFGHEAGDAALIALGTVLKTQTRGSDVVCRHGGDEFMIILGDTLPEDARKRAAQIYRAARQITVHYAGNPIGALTISIGIATFPENGLDPAALLHAADAAMYRAKSEGRDRMVMAK